MLKGFDPGNGKWYENLKEHITKQSDKGLESQTKKRIQDQAKGIASGPNNAFVMRDESFRDNNC
jgi:hypothetical protein